MINLYEILQKVLTEAVTPAQIVDAINNKYQVLIQYSDEKNRAPLTRLIEPYVYGISKAGNSVIRAYQYDGDSFRGAPRWKLFRLDRITSWQPTKTHFSNEPQARGWNAEKFNTLGDRSMSTVLSLVSFDDNNTNALRNGSNDQTQKIVSVPKSQPMNSNQFGPVNTNNKSTNNNRGPVNNVNNNITNNDENDANPNSRQY